MAYCPNCNSEIESNAVFCKSCSFDFPDENPYVDDLPYQFGLKFVLIAIVIVAVAVTFIYAAFIEPTRVTAALEDRVRRLNGEMFATNNCTIVSLKNQPVNDADLATLMPLLRKCPNLFVLDLSGTLVTDGSIELLDTLPEQLQSNVNLENTAVTDSGRLRVGGLRITNPDVIDALDRVSKSPP